MRCPCWSYPPKTAYFFVGHSSAAPRRSPYHRGVGLSVQDERPSYGSSAIQNRTDGFSASVIGHGATRKSAQFHRSSRVGDTDIPILALYWRIGGILEAENRALKKQLSEKDEVIDVLKKSVSILSKPFSECLTIDKTRYLFPLKSHSIPISPVIYVRSEMLCSLRTAFGTVAEIPHIFA